jgi:hypothetical protein
MIETQHATEPLPAPDAAALDGVGVHWHDELVAERLVIAFGLIVRDVLVDDLTQVAFAERDDASQALAANRAHEALGVGVQVWGSRRQPHTLDAARCEQRAESVSEQRVAIHDEVAMLEQEAINGVSQVAFEDTFR